MELITYKGGNPVNNIRGELKFQKKIVVHKQECYGKCLVRKNEFQVAISRQAGKTFSIFATTIFHELLHLALFIISASAHINISDRKHHKIIDSIVPRALWALNKYRGGK